MALDYDNDSLRDRSSPLLDAFYLANVERGVRFSIHNKLIKAGFDVDSWIVRPGLDTALKALGYDKFWQPHDTNGLPQG